MNYTNTRESSTILRVLLLFVLLFGGIGKAQTLNSGDVAIKLAVDKLVAEMTLEEKIGQMTQITSQVFSSQVGDEKTDQVFDYTKLRELIVDYHVGSLLNVYDKALTLDAWVTLITKMHDLTKETRLKIPVLYGIDAIHGVNYTIGATIFPHSFAMAASGNLDLMRKAGEITAYEMRACGIPWNFNPVLEVARNPMWPRFFETFGEDPFTVARFGEAYIYGMQGDDISAPTKVAACMKHYLGYSVPLSGQDRTPAWIPERQLREIFVPPFKAAVDAGTVTVMVNSADINGIPVHSDENILKKLLRNELGFEGLVVTDWDDINNLWKRDHIAATQRDAVRIAIMAGIDMSMVPMELTFYNHLLDLVKAGEVPMSRIDDAVRNILTVKYKIGLFENPYPDANLKKGFASEEFTKVNFDAACEVVTLLKNEANVLPLQKNKKYLVTGPSANLLSVMNGGWSITWQGNKESLFPQEKKTVLEAIQDKAGKENVTYLEGTSFDKDINIKDAVAKAKDVDYVIVCVGEPSYCETPGNIRELEMSEPQLDLVEALTASGKPVIMVILEGRPRVISRVADKVNGIVMGYLPGLEGGRAIAEILFGDANPSGKLPFTYPKYTSSFNAYDYKWMEDQIGGNKIDPQFPFGFGLSYTTFEYSNLTLSSAEIKPYGEVTVTVDVKNTGTRAGKEIVQLYITDVVASVMQPVRRLRGFEKINLAPGETKTVTFKITPDLLSFIGRDMKPVVESGEFWVTIGGIKQTFFVK